MIREISADRSRRDSVRGEADDLSNCKAVFQMATRASRERTQVQFWFPSVRF